MQGNEPLYGRILVPVKLCRNPEVGPYAFGLARATGGQVFFLNVDRGLEEKPDVGHPGEKDRFAERLHHLSETAGVHCHTLFRTGELAETVRQVADEIHADLVILTRRPDSNNLVEMETCLEEDWGPFRVPCPVMVVPSDSRRAVAQPIPARDTEPRFDASNLEERTRSARTGETLPPGRALPPDPE